MKNFFVNLVCESEAVMSPIDIGAAKPYPAYKASGVEWLGDVPAHWDITAVKRHYAIQLGKMLQNGQNAPNDTEVLYLKAQHIQWFRVRTNGLPTMWASPSDLVQFGVAPGDLLVCEGGEGGRCGILKQGGHGYIIQNALHRVRSRTHSQNEFLQYALSAAAATGWLAALNEKATIAHFTNERFGILKVSLPPFSEQPAIARFLDYMDRRITRCIEAKEKLIALLEEYRQVVISDAVTGRFNVRTGKPYPAYKASGVEWLGDVPAHWDITAVKRHYAIQLGKMLQNGQNAPNDTEVLYLKAQHVQWFRVRTNGLPTMWASPSDLVQFGVAPGDLLVCEGGEGGRCGILKQGGHGYIIQNALHRVRSRTHSQNEFLQYALSAAAATGWLAALNEKATIAHFTNERFGILKVSFPPFSEQSAIARFLDSKTEKIAEGILQAQNGIDLLHEYRTRLISDVVTGKLDVREAAAELPETESIGGFGFGKSEVV